MLGNRRNFRKKNRDRNRSNTETSDEAILPGPSQNQIVRSKLTSAKGPITSPPLGMIWV